MSQARFGFHLDKGMLNVPSVKSVFSVAAVNQHVKVSVVKPDGFDDRTLVVNCNPSSRFIVATIESEIKSIRVNYTLQFLSDCCNINLQ